MGEAGPSVPVAGASTENRAEDRGQPRAIPALPIRIIESPEEAEHARQREEKSDAHEANDLAAQRKAAEAADRSAAAAEWQKVPTWVAIGVAAVGTIVAIAGTVMLGLTLHWTRRTAEAGIRSADEAAKSHRAQFRPRIRVGLVTAEHQGEKRFTAGRAVSTSVDIINYGGYAAKIIGSHSQIWVGARLPMMRPYLKARPNDIYGQRILQAGVSCRGPYVHDCGLTAAEAEAVMNGTMKLFVMGWVQYEDADGIPRRTMFCYAYCRVCDRFFPTKDPDYEVEN